MFILNECFPPFSYFFPLLSFRYTGDLQIESLDSLSVPINEQTISVLLFCTSHYLLVHCPSHYNDIHSSSYNVFCGSKTCSLPLHGAQVCRPSVNHHNPLHVRSFIWGTLPDPSLESIIRYNWWLHQRLVVQMESRSLCESWFLFALIFWMFLED